MKYLKMFNESFESVMDIEKRFTEDVNEYLAYLLDDDSFKCSIRTNEDSIIFSLKKYHSVAIDIVKWIDVKDKLIPFFHFISTEYNIKKFHYKPFKNTDWDGTGKIPPEHNYESEETTIMFQRYIRSQYTSDWYYMDINDVIEDSKTVPEQFYQIVIKIDI